MGAFEPGHLLILLIVLFVVVGPSRLPEVGKAAGQALREFQRATAELRDSAQLDGPSSVPPEAEPADRPAAEASDHPGSQGA